MLTFDVHKQNTECTIVVKAVVLRSVDVVGRGKYDALSLSVYKRKIIMVWSTSMIAI